MHSPPPKYRTSLMSQSHGHKFRNVWARGRTGEWLTGAVKTAN